MRLTSAICALALLGGCAAVLPQANAPAPATLPAPGVVESASVVSLSGAGSVPTMAYRLRMADGSTRSVVQTGERFEVGEHVEVTGEGRLARQ